jgi:hypothetical protein
MMKARILMALLLVGVSVSAQQPTAIYSGRLVDPNGQPITNIAGTISARDTASGAEFRAEIPATGEFRLAGLSPGTYDITVQIRSAMYATYNEKSVTLKPGENRTDLHVAWGGNLGTFADDPATLANDIRARAKVKEGPTPRMPDGKPDFNGLWIRIVDPPGPPNPFPYTPWAADIDKRLRETPGREGMTTQAFCLPFSVLPFNASSFPHKIVQTPTVMVDIAEFDTPGNRQIFLDGRPHPDPARWNPAWLGHSVGKWEGDTLVVDTVGFNEMAAGVGVHSEKLHVVERLRRPDLSHLIIDMTVEDPIAYTRPWTISARYQLAPDDEEILEFICSENNQDPLNFSDKDGRPTLRRYTHRP